ncbi:MAG: hypothetical protein Q9219_007151 [cf. Caloplaca sp. 3 TL-2023]
MESAAKLMYRALPLIASPLEPTSSEQRERGIPEQVSRRRLSEGKTQPTNSIDEHHDDMIRFREREEASSIELFYDLFFVANLTSFTTVHPIDDKPSLSPDALQMTENDMVVLFDVRFGVDSLFERVAKLIHFGVMTTLAIVGTRFDPSRRQGAHVTMKQLSLVLVISRLVLIGQYASVILWVRKHRKITVPLAIHIITFTTGAIICMGFFFTFTPYSSGQAYVIWYVIIGLEALTVFMVSSHWRAISFQHTYLNERCGLLTLIILGEGVIVLTKSMNYLVQGENFSRSIIAQIISAVLVITSRVPPSSMLHHSWALVHFPFHTALVLLMEGTSRLITWRNALEIVDHILRQYSAIWNEHSTSTIDLSHQFGNFSAELLKSVDANPTKYNVTGYLKDLRYAGDPNGDEAVTAAFGIVLVLVNATLKFFKIEAAQAPDASSSVPSSFPASASTPGSGEPDPYSDLGAALNVYDLVFVYFFVAAGLTLVLMAVLMALNHKRGKKRYCKGDWVTMGFRGLIGTGLALVAVVKTNYSAEEKFLYSPWMVPTVMLAIGLVVLADGVAGWVFPRAGDEVGSEGKAKAESQV